MLHGAEGRRMMVPGFPDASGHFKKCGVFSHSLTREGRTMKLQCRWIYTAGQDQPSFQPGSVTRARSSLPDPHIQWKSTVNGNGGEFPACK